MLLEHFGSLLVEASEQLPMFQLKLHAHQYLLDMGHRASLMDKLRRQLESHCTRHVQPFLPILATNSLLIYDLNHPNAMLQLTDLLNILQLIAFHLHHYK